MKKARWLFLVLLILVISIFGDIPRPFPLSQPKEQIAKIELLYNQINNNDPLPTFTVLSEIQKNQVDEFVSNLLQLDCRRNGFDPSTDFGELLICITYKNGDLELIGPENNAYVTTAGTKYDVYYFRDKDFKEFFEQYAGDSMPENAMFWVE